MTGSILHSLVTAQTVIPNFGHADDCVRQNRTFCWGWFSDHWDDVFQPALLDHIKLTLIAVVVGFAIAIACAIFAYGRGWFERPFSVFAGVHDAVLDRFALEDDFGARLPGGSDLRQGCALGHEDGRGEATGPRRVRDRLAVVARARGDDTLGAVVEPGDLVEGAAQLE